jgi:hypothetical protein
MLIRAAKIIKKLGVFFIDLQAYWAAKPIK